MQAATKAIKDESALARTLRRELVSRANRAQLARMPAFKPVDRLPDYMKALLEQMGSHEA